MFCEEEIDSFEYIKTRARQSPNTIGDVHFCGAAADLTIELLAGKNAQVLLYDLNSVLMGQFFDKENNGKYTYETIEKLFTQNSKPEHVAYHIVLGGRPAKGHVFVVEKKGDGKTTFWRVYQSFFFRFTLNHWLKNKAYNGSKEYFRNQIKNFGGGKKLTCTELIEFINIIFKNKSIPRDYPMRISVYKVKPRKVNYVKAVDEFLQLTSCLLQKITKVNELQLLLKKIMNTLGNNSYSKKICIEKVCNELREFEKKYQNISKDLKEIVKDYVENFYKPKMTDIKKELYYETWIKDNPARFYLLVQWEIYIVNAKKIINTPHIYR